MPQAAEADVEIGVLVTTGFEPVGRVIASELPGGEVATATHRGDYARLGARLMMPWSPGSFAERTLPRGSAR